MSTDYNSQEESGSYHVAQQDVEQQPVPLPMFKRLRITPHDCTVDSTSVDISEKQSMMQQHPYLDRLNQHQANITDQPEMQYTKINQVLGSLHRERRNRSQYHVTSDGYHLCDQVEYQRYNSNQECNSESNSISSLSSCTAAHTVIEDKAIPYGLPRSYPTASQIRKKLYTDSRLL